jgi:hypothetical protein
MPTLVGIYNSARLDFNLEIGPKLLFQPTVKTFSSLHSPPPKGEARLKPKATDHVAD